MSVPGVGFLLQVSGADNILKEFMDEISDKIHKHGWCEDPDCEHNKK